MPYESAKQRRFMWARHPDIAQRWANEGHDYVMKHGEKLKRHHAMTLRAHKAPK